MRMFKKFIPLLYLLIFAIWSTQAQQQCALDVEEIIARVSSECADIDSNQVCYGNHDVRATARDNARFFRFTQPGDLVNLSSIQSLIVESVNVAENTWGVAQMNLLVGSDAGLQDVSMLLFGEFDIRNAVSNSDSIDLEVIVRQKTLHTLPDSQSEVLDTVGLNARLLGLARLEDSSWIRVENPETRVVGWVEAGGIEEVDESRSIGILSVHLPEQPYFGAMQAFYFRNGTSDIGCDTVESDGLIIQTPEGQARVTLLINEVSIELVGGRNNAGENESGRAFIQANPLNPQGMSVNVLRGTASVESGGTVTTVESGQQTSIPISVDLVARGEPRTPEASNVSIAIEPLLPAVNSINNNTGNSGTGNNTITIGSNTGGGSNNGGSSTNISGVNINTGGSSDNSSNSGSGSGINNTGGSSSTGVSNGNTIGITTGNSSGTTGTNPINSGTGTGTDRPDNRAANFGFGEDADVIAAALAVIAAILIVPFLIWSARQRRDK